VSAGEEPTADLLRVLARDVAHELRGPIQSILVNLEVLRRRARKGDAAATLERADVIEQEVRRIHALSDAFLGVLQPTREEVPVLAAETLLASLDPITQAHARSGRISWSRSPCDGTVFLRVHREPAALALLCVFLAVCATLEPGAHIEIGCSAGPDAVEIRMDGMPAAASGPLLELSLARARQWLQAVQGTVTAAPVSDHSRITMNVRLPRALSLTPPAGEE
jgi:signal transduction histidine kinase